MEAQEYIYHITTRNAWQTALSRGIYSDESLKTEGFIHCSRKEQVAGSANNYFKGKDNLIVLEIDTSKVKSDIRYENLIGGTELFPHLYSELKLESVVNNFPLVKDDKGNFIF